MDDTRTTGSLRAWIRHAFALEPSGEPADEEEQAMVRRLARFLVTRRLTAPALVALEAGRPLSFLGSQLLAFLSPFLGLVFRPDETSRFIRFLEKRGSVDRLADEVIRLENERDA